MLKAGTAEEEMRRYEMTNPEVSPTGERRCW